MAVKNIVSTVYIAIFIKVLKRNIDTNDIVKTKDFKKPIETLKNGNYKMKFGIVYTCFSTYFSIVEADEWQKDCFKMFKENKTVHSYFLPKELIDFKNALQTIGMMATIM